MDGLARRLVPDELWDLADPLLPGPARRPQGGGRSTADRRAVLTAVVYVVTSGSAWQMLPPYFGVAIPTAHRWFLRWSRAGVWRKLHDAVLAGPHDPALAEWTRAILDGAASRETGYTPG
ncbi:transposase [Nocardiopsis sediminis]|uniref:Transposase n=1 Tax=Nocardiopsis sediminis TaxID=1778267 RepID=A0ABV8FQW1_9ACTN